jgi:hypothetical protein
LMHGETYGAGAAWFLEAKYRIVEHPLFNDSKQRAGGGQAGEGVGG